MVLTDDMSFFVCKVINWLAVYQADNMTLLIILNVRSVGFGILKREDIIREDGQGIDIANS